MTRLNEIQQNPEQIRLIGGVSYGSAVQNPHVKGCRHYWSIENAEDARQAYADFIVGRWNANEDPWKVLPPAEKGWRGYCKGCNEGRYFDNTVETVDDLTSLSRRRGGRRRQKLIPDEYEDIRV